MVDEMFCSECGSGLENQPKFCPNCGAAIGVKAPELDVKKLTTELVDTHLGLLGGYGSVASDRSIIEEAITNLFNEIHKVTEGENLFTFDPVTRACSSDTTDEFAESIAPQVIDIVLTSAKVQEYIRPCISSFMNWFVYSIDIPIHATTKHIMFLNNLKDTLSDANLTFFGFTSNAEIVKNFYLDEYPEGKNEFFSLLTSIADQSKSGEIEVLPGNQPWFAPGTDRKEQWDNVKTHFEQSFFPVKTTVKEILGSNSWLDEHLVYLQTSMPSFLAEEFVALIQCQEMVTGNKSPISGKEKILLFSDQGICEIYTKEKHRRGTSPHLFQREIVSEISIGTETHESHGGFTSSASTFMVITIHTTNYEVHTKYMHLGDNEQELNSSRPGIMRKLEQIAKFYSLVEGDVAQSSSGYTLTPSIGFWQSLD
jgi:hypothetical protein